MIFDACTFVGRWPFAKMRHQTVRELLLLLDKNRIDNALVSPLEGAFYQNCQEANEDLFFEIGRDADRLKLVAAINPSYPGWDKDMKRSHEVLAAAGVRLFPNYHGYSLMDSNTEALADLAADFHLPVFVTVRIQDERHHPVAFQIPPTPVEELIQLANRHPKTYFVISMGRFGEITQVITKTTNVYADFAGVQGPTLCIKKLVAEAGQDRLLFGTELLFQYALPSRLKVEYSDLPDEIKETLYIGNLNHLFDTVQNTNF